MSSSSDLAVFGLASGASEDQWLELTSILLFILLFIGNFLALSFSLALAVRYFVAL